MTISRSDDRLLFSAPVSKALRSNKPVALLETTLISHGLPRDLVPTLVNEMTSVIEAEGVVPVFVALIDGRIKFGIDDSDVAQLSSGGGVLRLNNSNVFYGIAGRHTGGLTVSAVLSVSRFVCRAPVCTGGIGGVHKNFSDTWDVSPDLEELAVSESCVVSSGPKSFLNLRSTLAALETRGVPVVTFGSEYIPGYWTRSSGIKSALTTADPLLIAELVRQLRVWRRPQSCLVLNPIAKEFEIPPQDVQSIISAVETNIACRKSESNITPSFLAEAAVVSNNRTALANIEMLKSNAALAAKISKFILVLK